MKPIRSIENRLRDYCAVVYGKHVFTNTVLKVGITFMLENNVIQISAGKLLGVSLLPSSILLVSGIIIWQIWRNKQSRLQTETDVLNDELRQIKKQMADLQTANSKAESDESMQTVNTSSAVAQQTSKKSASQKSDKSPGEMGLFECLIEDNIQLRQSSLE